MVDGGVDEEIPPQGFAAKQEAMDHAFAANEGDDDFFLHAGEAESGFHEDPVGGMAGGGADSFA